MRHFQVIVPQGNDVKKKESIFQELLVNLHNTVKNTFISLECLGFEQYTYFFIVLPDNLFETVEGLIYSTFPDCEIVDSKDYVDNFDPEKKGICGAKMNLKFGDVYPFKTHDEFDEDSQSRFFSVISKIASGEQVWVQLIINPQLESAGYHLKRRFALWKNN